VNSFLFVAGDPSGDERAAEVVREIKSRDPACRVTALGGPALKAAADRFLYDLVAESVMGFWEPLKKIPRFWRILNGVVRPALREETGVVVPTDFYGFNRHVAAAAKAAGRRVVYYVSPQVWASRPGRIDVLKKAVDRVLVIFPFEEALYRERGVPVTFVGHPLIDALPPADPDAPLNVEATVGLLPGSRPGEVRRLLPVMLEAAERLTAARPGLRFVLFAASSLSNAFYDALLGGAPRRNLFLEMVRDEAHRRRRGLDAALACSGTATLENALLGIPTVVAYKTSWPTYLLARLIVRVNHIAMPNILAGRTVMPERIQAAATPAALAEALAPFLDDPARRRASRRELIDIRRLLGGGGAAARAAQALRETAA
jgi:lipid-A-disaccharide synthase